MSILTQICNFNPNCNIRFLYYDSFYQKLYQKRVCNLFLALYICTVWRSRKENLRIGILSSVLKRAIKENLEVMRQLTKKSLEELFGPYGKRLTCEELDKLH